MSKCSKILKTSNEVGKYFLFFQYWIAKWWRFCRSSEHCVWLWLCLHPIFCHSKISFLWKIYDQDLILMDTIYLVRLAIIVLTCNKALTFWQHNLPSFCRFSSSFFKLLGTWWHWITVCAPMDLCRMESGYILNEAWDLYLFCNYASNVQMYFIGLQKS